MKVYVSELPKKCLKCPCFDNCGYICKINRRMLDTVGKGSADNSRDEDCPLHSLTDYTKQVRKEVIDEIKENLLKLEPNCIKQPNLYDFNCQEIIDILDQIQGDDPNA